MRFFNVLYFVTLSLSMAYMYSFSEIFRPIRKRLVTLPVAGKVLACPECTAFWIGCLVSLFYNPIVPNVTIVSNIFCGLVTYLFASIIYKKLFL
jgi:hypothetical protein